MDVTIQRGSIRFDLTTWRLGLIYLGDYGIYSVLFWDDTECSDFLYSCFYFILSFSDRHYHTHSAMLDIHHTRIDWLGLEMEIDFEQPRENGVLLTSLPTDAVLFLCGLLAVMGRLLFFPAPFLDDGGVHSNSDAASRGKGTGRVGR